MNEETARFINHWLYDIERVLYRQLDASRTILGPTT
jgi:hypothetical protein